MKLSCYLLLVFFLVGCTPKIYVIDRHTMLEQEAAGSWPAVEASTQKIMHRKTGALVPVLKQSDKQKTLSEVLPAEAVQ